MTTSVMITGSSVRRIMRCPGSAKLAQIRTLSTAASKGTVVHAFLEDMGRGTTLLAALDRVPRELHDECARIKLDELPIDARAYDVEIAFAYDTETGTARRLTSTGKHRDYADVKPTEIACTTDVIEKHMDGEDRGYVADYKTGWGSDETAPPAAENEQLHFAALCLARTHGYTSVVVELIKIDSSGMPFKDRHTLDVFALEDFEHRLLAMWKRVHAEVADFTVGAHCDWCPAFRACPAQVGLLQGLMANGHGMEIEATQQVVERIMLLRKVLDEAKDQIDKLSDQVPIPMGDGKQYGPKSERHVIGGKAKAYLKQKYGERVAGEMMEVKENTSQSAIKEVLGKNAIITSRTAKEHMDNLMDELQAVGATKSVVRHTIHKVAGRERTED